MTTICTSRELRYIALTAAAILFLVISLTQVEDKYAAVRYTKLVHPFKQAKRHEVPVSNITLTELTPEMRLHALCTHVDTVNRLKMTSLRFSKLKLIKIDNEGNITVAIETFDMRNKSKGIGDDVIVIWASQENGDGLVSGRVIDHKNGSYTGNIKVYWTGRTKVTVKLASSLENTCLRLKALRKYGNTVFAMQKAWGIRGTFRTSLIQELTTCGANEMIFGYKNVCNFTTLNGGMSWYCGKPKHERIKCSDIESFGTGPFHNSMVPQIEKVQNTGHGIFQQKLILNIPIFREEIKHVSCSLRSPLSSWTDSEPSGYWLDNKWNFVNCYSNIKHDVKSYAQCLKNKNVVIIGDSTVRQYAEYFIEKVLDLGHFDMRDAIGPNRQYHSDKLFTNYGINLMYVKHEMPFHNPNFPPTGIVSVPQILNSMANNTFRENSLILVINYNSHFSAYPPSKFRERIKQLVIAIEKLLLRLPTVKIFFKGPHLCIDDSRWFDSKLSLLFEEIIRQEFFKLRNKVIYLDIWPITVAHNSENLHPTGNAFSSQIHQLMSYIC